MKIEIKHRHTSNVIFTGSAENLRSANLRSANLSGADLSGADLYGANLSGANLYGANLYGANLYGANLSGADLQSANLQSAILRSADLYGANLRSADLSGANLQSANLSGADLEKAVSQRTIVAKGDLIGYKKLVGGVIAKLKIPAKARRLGGLTGRKCRAEYAKVIEGTGYTSAYGPKTLYRPGKIVRPDSFDPDPLNVCSHGIHFYITRAEAEAH